MAIRKSYGVSVAVETKLQNRLTNFCSISDRGKNFFLFSETSRSAWGSTQRSFFRGGGAWALFAAVKLPRRVAAN